MENFVVAVIVAAVGSGGLSSILVAWLQRKWKKEDNDCRIDELAEQQKDFAEKQKALINSQKVTMIDRVRHLAKRYIEQECITLEDKENLEDMFKSYKELGGNGHLDTIMSEVRKLRVVSEHCSDI